MQRTRFTGTPGQTKRLLLLAIPVALLVVLAFTFAVVFTAQRTLNGATHTAATEGQLAFTLKPLDPAALQANNPGFEPVAANPDYTTGTYFSGKLYLAGPAGLTILGSDGQPQRSLRTGLELPVEPIVALAAARPRGASEPQLLLATRGGGLILLQPNGDAAPTLQQLLPREAESRDLTALLPLATGELLLGTRRRGVLLYNGSTLSAVGFHLAGVNPATLQITALAAVDAASFLIGTRNAGVFYAHAGTVEHATAATGLPDDQVEAMTVAHGRAFVGTPLGTAEFDLAAFPFQVARVLGAGWFSHTLAVEGNQLSIGTLDQGIQQVSLDTRAHLRRASISVAAAPSSAQRVDAFLAGPDGTYALADGSLLRRGNSGWTSALPAPGGGLADRNISALAFAPDGTLYVGFFDHGLDILSATGGPTRHLEDDHLFCINRLVLDPQRRTMAAATANGLVLFDAQGTPRQTLTRRDGLISDHVTDIAFTRTGTALATPAGITFIGPASTESLYAFQGLVNNHVYALAATPGQDQLLAGTLGGLSILEANAVRRNLTVTNSALGHNWITALLPTGDGSTLVGTYGAGVQRLDRQGNFTPIELPAATPHDLVINPNALFATPDHLYAGTLGHGLLVFSKASGRWSLVTHGLPSLNVTAFAERDGELYVGTEDGLVRISEAKVP